MKLDLARSMILSIFSESNPLFVLSVLLVCGFALGHVARKLRLPSLIGQIVAGILIGPYVLGLFPPDVFRGLAPVTGFALCLFGLALGAHINLRRLHNAGKRITSIAACEALILPTVIFLTLFFVVRLPLPPSLLLSAIGLSTSPSSIIQLISEKRAKGILTKTLTATVALNNCVALVFFSIALEIALHMAGHQNPPGMWKILAAPGRVLLTAVLLGGGLGLVVCRFTRRKSSSAYNFSLLIVCLLLLAGVSQSLRIPGFLSSVVFGLVIGNSSAKRYVLLRSLGGIQNAVFVLFFVMAGTQIDFGAARAAGIAGVAFVVARGIGKYLGPTLGAYLAGTPPTIRRWIGIALFPHADIAIGFMLIVASYPQLAGYSDLITTVVLCSVVVFQCFGPLFTDIAIEMAGEKNRDQSRLLDFLQEEYILVGLKSTDKWKSLEELATFMHRVHGITEISLDDLVSSVISREKEMSTAIGEGIAVPHAIIEGGPKIRGVIGVSHKGIDFGAMDDQPVHLVVLIATPMACHDQHLRVLASIAKIFGQDPEIRDQIYLAEGPAEVHEVLQTGYADLFNVYLQEQ